MKNLLLALFILIAGTTSAQSFFKPLPKVNEPREFALSLAVQKDSILNTIRPVASLVSYTIPGNILMAGAGISYQHLKWDYTNNKWNCIYSISALGYAGGSVAPSTPSQIVSYGIVAGFFNNLLLVGAALNGNKVIATIGLGISLNN